MEVQSADGNTGDYFLNYLCIKNLKAVKKTSNIFMDKIEVSKFSLERSIICCSFGHIYMTHTLAVIYRTLSDI